MNLLLGLLVNGVVGTVVFAILLAIRPISIRLFSKTWHYYSLLIPLAFLLAGNLLPQLAIDINTGNTLPQNQLAVPASSIFTEPAFVAHATEAIVITQDASHIATEHVLAQLAIIAPYIVSFWLFGAVLFICINARKYLKYRGLVLRGAKPCPDANCLLPVFISQAAHTPMLLGVIKPIIVLPPTKFSHQELEIILAHEMIHHKRKDLLYKALGFIANALHWYNPAAYAINRQLDILCELSCDEKLAISMDDKDRKLYGETILRVLDYGAITNNLLFTTNLCSPKKNIKRRLTNMMNTKKIKNHVVMLSLIAGAFVLGAGFIISHLVDSAVPIYAAGEQEYIAYEVAEVEAEAAIETEVEIETVAEVEIETEVETEADADANPAMNIDANADAVLTVAEPHFVWPVPISIWTTSGYGERINPYSKRIEFHAGIDIPAAEGSEVVAVYMGTVIFSGWLDGYGNTIIIEHEGGLTTLYAHNKSHMVSNGDEVAAGQIIAFVGSTGITTGPNLHFELRQDGQHKDPMPYFQ